MFLLSFGFQCVFSFQFYSNEPRSTVSKHVIKNQCFHAMDSRKVTRSTITGCLAATIERTDSTTHKHDLPYNTTPNQDKSQLGTLIVPSVGIGTIAWSSDSLFKLGSPELQKLVNKAVDRDAAFFDTAERYGSHAKTALGGGWGETENLIRILTEKASIDHSSTMMKHKPIIATKFTPSPWRNTMESVVEACEQSCARLGVDQIDLYQLHMPDIVQPLRFLGKEDNKNKIYWEGLAECYNRGLVKNVGVCNYGPTLLSQCHEALAKRGVPLASNQIAFSLIGRHNGAQETLDRCNEMGVKVLASFPFAMGLLTGKYSHRPSPENKFTKPLLSLSTNKKTFLENRDLKRYAEGGDNIPNGGIQPLLEVMESIASTRGKTVSQVALNYIICKGAVPIPGARTEEQVLDNIGAMGWRLSHEEILKLEQVADALGFGFDGAGFKRTSEKFVGYGVEKWSLD